MGTDIHWGIERRDSKGKWHLVLEETRCLYMCGWVGISCRDYRLFAALSSVRSTDGAPGIATEGLPEGVSEALVAEAELGLDYSSTHTPGYVEGSDILEWAGEESVVQHWAQGVVALMESGRADFVVPSRTPWDGPHHGEWADIARTEGFFARLKRGFACRKLVPWREDSTSWRIVIWYDS